MRHLFLINIFAIMALSVLAAQPQEQNYYDLNLDQNIESPVIPAKRQNAVKENVDKLKSNLERDGFKCAKLRRGEVILISIPCKNVFLANESNISPRGNKLLDKLKTLSDYQSKYKLLIAVHTDDTGEEGYADMITSERANAIYDYLLDTLNLKDMIIVPYGLGRDEPLVKNDSAKNRNQNRRIEIYLVPLI